VLGKLSLYTMMETMKNRLVYPSWTTGTGNGNTSGYLSMPRVDRNYIMEFTPKEIEPLLGPMFIPLIFLASLIE
jgi:hypothetical protein